jgi:hypothetical protein
MTHLHTHAVLRRQCPNKNVRSDDIEEPGYSKATVGCLKKVTKKLVVADYSLLARFLGALSSASSIIENSENRRSTTRAMWCCDPQDELTSGSAREAAPPPVPGKVVEAPPGKLGVIFGKDPATGYATVKLVRDTSPLMGKIEMNDIVIAIDGEDTSTHTHEEIVRRKFCRTARALVAQVDRAGKSA